jgi:hypothetical protein
VEEYRGRRIAGEFVDDFLSHILNIEIPPTKMI